MGQWQLVINAVGSHDIDHAASAEVMAAKFADELRAAGHQVLSVTVGCPAHMLVNKQPNGWAAGLFSRRGYDYSPEATDAPETPPGA